MDVAELKVADLKGCAFLIRDFVEDCKRLNSDTIYFLTILAARLEELAAKKTKKEEVASELTDRALLSKVLDTVTDSGDKFLVELYNRFSKKSESDIRDVDDASLVGSIEIEFHTLLDEFRSPITDYGKTCVIELIRRYKELTQND